MLTPFEEELVVGSHFADRFLIMGVVGRGSMGIVYQARHELMHRLVAIKMLRGQLQSDERSMRRFEREARAASRMDHPNLIAVHDFGLTNNRQPYLVMEYVQGSTLYDIQKCEDHLTPVRAVRIFTQVCDALQHAHVQGVIHRDLKPSNIMIIEKDGEGDFVKVFDLGIAKIAWGNEEDKEPLTNTNEVCGSPIYLSPEQCKHLALDARSDIYSFGVVMYELLTGVPPLMGETVYDTIYMHVHEQPRSFAEVRPDLQVSTRLEKIVLKALAKNPEDRHQSMQELKWELQASLQASDPHLKVLPPDAFLARRRPAADAPAVPEISTPSAAMPRVPTPRSLPVVPPSAALKNPTPGQSLQAVAAPQLPESVETPREGLSTAHVVMISSATTTIVILIIAAVLSLTLHKQETHPVAGAAVPAAAVSQVAVNPSAPAPNVVPHAIAQVVPPSVAPIHEPSRPAHISRVSQPEHSPAPHTLHGRRPLPAWVTQRSKQQAKQQAISKPTAKHSHAAPVAVAHKAVLENRGNGSMPFWGFFPGWQKPAVDNGKAANQAPGAAPPSNRNMTPVKPLSATANAMPVSRPVSSAHFGGETQSPAGSPIAASPAAAHGFPTGAPDEAVRLNNEGQGLTRSDPAAAIQKFREALTRYPSYDLAKLNMGRAYVNYGNRLHDSGNDREAERQYQAAIEIFNQYHTPEAMRALQTARANYEVARASAGQ